ncbi:hypothetical protein HDU98_009617, partial [Podochytrium sp. JEL0797]
KGFTDRDIVTLMGGHNLGFIHPNVTNGWLGKWSQTPTAFSNAFYINLQDVASYQLQSNGLYVLPSLSDNSPTPMALLPSDVALTQDAAFKAIVNDYGNSQQWFYGNFSDSFARLLELGVADGLVSDFVETSVPRVTSTLAVGTSILEVKGDRGLRPLGLHYYGNKVCLIVIDGWGIAPAEESVGNAVLHAETPVMDAMAQSQTGYTTLAAHGLAVGLPDGLMGNSEVGHLNIGAGRVVYQDIVRIDLSVKNKTLASQPHFAAALQNAKNGNGRLHFAGLLSDGGVHSHQEHLYAMLEAAKDAGVPQAYIHAFGDGRDTSPRSAATYLEQLKVKLDALHYGTLATVVGRYYAMDRDKRWERVKLAYDAIVLGAGEKECATTQSFIDAVKECYTRDITDEFLKPLVLPNAQGTIQDNDTVIFFNYRSDRMRELSAALGIAPCPFEAEKIPKNLNITTMTQYKADYPFACVFPPQKMDNVLAEWLGKKAIPQCHIAETEKYAHVTFFFNGGSEAQFLKEERELIPSPRVATYDLKPSMSAIEVGHKTAERIGTNQFPFVMCNFAPPDMVGHTGIYPAAMKGVEATDEAIGIIAKACKDNGYILFVTADHGNAEKMIAAGGTPHTAHTCNVVPFVMDNAEGKFKRPGRADALDNQDDSFPDNTLPNANFTASDIRTLFAAKGFTDRDIWLGKWSQTPTAFSNAFYINLQDVASYQLQRNGLYVLPSLSDNSPTPMALLPSDVALTQDAAFKAIVNDYGNGQQWFYGDFSDSFARLLELGVADGLVSGFVETSVPRVTSTLAVGTSILEVKGDRGLRPLGLHYYGNKVCLIVIDGWGIAPAEESVGNAVLHAETPVMDAMAQSQTGYTTLAAHGLAVGLPDGLMGNSEVGHLNIGAGRVVYQDIVRIDLSVKNKTLASQPHFAAALQNAKNGNGRLHFAGLLSDGGVHSHQEHLYAMLEAAKDAGVPQAFIHAFGDGRDTSPRSAATYLEQLKVKLDALHYGTLATVVGRYYAMDRDKRWERVKLAYDAIVLGAGEKECATTQSFIDAVKECYTRDITDEFLKPLVLPNAQGTIQDNDTVIFFNYRSDRMRELSAALGIAPCPFEAEKIPKNLNITTMTQYKADYPFACVFPPQKMDNVLAEWLGKKAIPQCHIAETEKYAHVTFFFNGGSEAQFLKEERELIPSPRVATYDLKPSMSAIEVGHKTAERIGTNQFPFVMCNFAPPDMVGHTGIYPAAMKGVEATDEAIGIIAKACKDNGYILFVTADHGNAEKMIAAGGTPHTAHTCNVVPFVMDNAEGKFKFVHKVGCLADVAPTILDVMGLDIPAEMDGVSMLANFAKLCSAIIILCPSLAVKHELESRLWKSGFHSCIESIRRTQQTQQSATTPFAKASWTALIAIAVQTFTQLLAAVHAKRISSGDAKQSPSVPGYAKYVGWLGDLARYRTMLEVDGTKLPLAIELDVVREWYRAKDMYALGAFLAPSNGQFFNHLAIFELNASETLSSLCYFMRALNVKAPFQSAYDSIMSLCAGNRTLYESTVKSQKKAKQRGGGGKQDKSQPKQPDETIESTFLRAFDILYTRINIDNLAPILEKLTTQLAIEEGVSSSNPMPPTFLQSATILVISLIDTPDRPSTSDYEPPEPHVSPSRLQTFKLLSVLWKSIMPRLSLDPDSNASPTNLDALVSFRLFLTWLQTSNAQTCFTPSASVHAMALEFGQLAALARNYGIGEPPSRGRILLREDWVYRGFVPFKDVLPRKLFDAEVKASGGSLLQMYECTGALGSVRERVVAVREEMWIAMEKLPFFELEVSKNVFVFMEPETPTAPHVSAQTTFDLLDWEDNTSPSLAFDSSFLRDLDTYEPSANPTFLHLQTRKTHLTSLHPIPTPIATPTVPTRLQIENTTLLFDTNCYIRDVPGILALIHQGWQVLLPLVVITELDGLSGGGHAGAQSALAIVEPLLRTRESKPRNLSLVTYKGTPLPFLSIRTEDWEWEEGVKGVDDVLLRCAQQQQGAKAGEGRVVVFVTGDVNLRVKARGEGVVTGGLEDVRGWIPGSFGK